MKIYIEKDNRSLDLKKDNINGKKLLEELRINPSSIILVKNNEVVLDDEVLEDKDDIKILSVVSGG
jgi:sulfur carrier protein ThiS